VTRSERIMLAILTAGLALTLASCGAGTAGEVRVQIEKVPVRAPCPDKKTYDDLKSSRPTPLRAQPMPATPDVRVAKTAAQLGRYEAPGGWGDRAVAALDRCQQGEDLTPSP
jgi:hypothetical protein